MTHHWKMGVIFSTFFMLLLASLIFFSPAAHAASCDGIDTSVIDCSGAKDTTDSPVVAFLVIIIQLLTGLVGVVAIGAFIYAGVLYSSASGNVSQTGKAKEIIVNTVIGLVVFAAMALLLNWLIPGGIFNGSGTFGAGGNGLGDNTLKNSDLNKTGSTATSSGKIDPATIAARFSVATYNIRGSDQTSWDSVRSNAILNYMMTVDTVGTQEGREQSMKWLTPRMKAAGYAVTSNKWARNVWWKTSKFTLVKQGEKQLPNDKDLIWAKLREKTSSKTFYVGVVHLNVLGSSKRMAELRVAMPYIKSTMSDAPVIFLGDMNSEPDSTEDKYIKSNGFKDSYDVANVKKNITYRTTLSGFTGKLTGKLDSSSDHQIDHIYVKGSIIVDAIEVKLQKGSDHLPVQATIVLPK